MNKTFQQTTYHINQYLEIRWEILDHLGWKSIPGPSKTSVPVVKTMNSEPRYLRLSLPQVSVQEKTFVSMLDLIRIGWINTFASALWTCVWTLYYKDTIIKYYLIIEIIDHIFGNLYCEASNYFIYLKMAPVEKTRLASSLRVPYIWYLLFLCFSALDWLSGYRNA